MRPKPGLDLVPDEQHALLVAHLADEAVVLARELDVAAVALDGLHQEGRGRAVDAASDGVAQQVGVMRGEVSGAMPTGGRYGFGLGTRTNCGHQPVELVVGVRPAGGHATTSVRPW